MTIETAPETSQAITRRRAVWQRLALRWLAGITNGELALTFPGGGRHVAAGANPGPKATIAVERRRAVRRVVLRGDIGFAEGYMEGDWSTPDLQAVMDFVYANEHALLEPMAASPVMAALLRLRHWLRPNTPAGARRNIAEHYDLGNEFYRLWLDPSMTYSSALFEAPEASIEEAQAAKYRRVVHTLGLTAGDHVLEIGCGWGGFAEFAARETGCKVTGITLSQEQAAFARARIGATGLAERVDIRIEDYRHVRGAFDKIASIEMFEAVGEENWPVYFRALADRLKPGGVATIQTIVVADQRFASYRRNIDFIRRYIFPGGLLPAPSRFKEEVARAGLMLADVRFFGESYVRTLIHWNAAFLSRWRQIAALGFDERFRRMWSYYLCGCAASFRARATDVGQFVIRKA